MSTVAEILSSAQDGKLIENLAQNAGLTTEQTTAAVEALIPALSLGLRNAASNPEVLERTVAGLVDPAHQAAYRDPAAACSAETRALGARRVSDLFGSGAAAGRVAQIAARDIGLRPDVLTGLLPVLASVVFGGLFESFKRKGQDGSLARLAEAGALGPVLDSLGAPAAAEPTPPAAGSERRGGFFGNLLGSLFGSLFGGGTPVPLQPAPASTLPGDLGDTLGQLVQRLNALVPAAAEATGRTAELQDVLDRVT